MLDEAAEHLQRAIQVDPKYGLAHTNLGNVYLLQRNFAQAAFHYRSAIRINPHDTKARQNLERIPANPRDNNQR